MLVLFLKLQKNSILVDEKIFAGGDKKPLPIVIVDMVGDKNDERLAIISRFAKTQNEKGRAQ